MKKILTGFSVAVFILVIAFTAYAQKNHKNENKHEQGQGKGNKPDKQKGNGNGKGNAGQQSRGNKEGKHDDNNNGRGKNDKNKGNGNNDHDRGNKGRDDDKDKDKERGNNGVNKTTVYAWNRENFKDRKKLKNGEKVTVCHKFRSNNEPGVTINVSSNALQAHLNHGDVTGACPVIADNRYSDLYLRRRADYYNDLQNTQEQVIYSRSILDYALERLNNSRLQLVTLRNNNAPVVEIQRKEAVIVQLEQNVSLLQTLLGVAVNFVAQKLSD